MNGDDLTLMRQRAVSEERFATRKNLLDRFDRFRSAVDTAEMAGMATSMPAPVRSRSCFTVLGVIVAISLFSYRSSASRVRKWKR